MCLSLVPGLYPDYTACPSCPFHNQSHCIRTWCLYSQYFGTTIDLLSSKTNGLPEGLLCFASVFACHSALFCLWDFIILPLNTPGLLFCVSFNGLTPHHLFEICLLPKVQSFFTLAPLCNSFHNLRWKCLQMYFSAREPGGGETVQQWRVLAALPEDWSSDLIQPPVALASGGTSIFFWPP